MKQPRQNSQITDIKKQQARSRYSIYIDGDYVFSLSDWQLQSLSLKVGQVVDREELEQFKESSELGKLNDKMLTWLSMRPRSSRELQDYIRRKTDSEIMREHLFAAAEKTGRVNDEVFAHAWVHDRRKFKRTSDRILLAELRSKGVSESIAKAAIADAPSSEQDALKELILKKQQSTRYKDQEKLLAFLARKGFNYGEIRQALQELALDSDSAASLEADFGS